MSNAFDHENTIYGGYGEFDTYGTDGWTAEDWAAHDAHIADEMRKFDEKVRDGIYGFDLDPHIEFKPF